MIEIPCATSGEFGDKLKVEKYSFREQLLVTVTQDGEDACILLDLDGAVLLAQELATFLRANVERAES